MDHVEQIRSEIEGFLKERYAGYAERSRYPEMIPEIMAEKLNGLLPVVLEVRNERGSTGALTKEDYDEAAKRRTHADLRANIDRLSERATAAVPGLKKDMMTMMVANGEAFFKDMRELDTSDEAAAEIRLQQITADAVSRLEAVTEMIRQRREGHE